LFFGVKNLFNFTPARSTPFLIARSADPFDRGVSFDSQGNPIQSTDNPYALTFDPTYVYAPNQGRRVFLGFRMSLNQ
jgi:outer membrane receptor for ferrienterochelin and colicins